MYRVLQHFVLPNRLWLESAKQSKLDRQTSRRSRVMRGRPASARFACNKTASLQAASVCAQASLAMTWLPPFTLLFSPISLLSWPKRRPFCLANLQLAVFVLTVAQTPTFPRTKVQTDGHSLTMCVCVCVCVFDCDSCVWQQQHQQPQQLSLLWAPVSQSVLAWPIPLAACFVLSLKCKSI